MQPLNVCINKPFKYYFKDEFKRWFNEIGENTKNTGKTSNIKPQMMERIIEIGVNSWNSIKEDTVIKSLTINIYIV